MRLRGRAPLDLALLLEELQRADHHRVGVDEEVPTGGGAGVREAELVGAERREAVRHERADLVRPRGGVVRGGHDRALGPLQRLRHVGHARGGGRVLQGVLLRRDGVAVQLVVGGHRPHGGVHAPLLGEDPLGVERPRHGDAGAQELDLRAVALALGETVDALEQALHVEALGLLDVGDRLVVHREVVDDVADVVPAVVVAVHVLQALAHDVGDLVRVRRVVVLHGRVRGRQDGGVTVHVLGALAGEGGAPGGGADHEAARELVACGPDVVRGPLEAEHRVEDVHRDHRLAVRGVRRADRVERRGGAVLVDADVVDLPLRGLLVGQEQVPVHGQVVLALGVVDLRGREERVHAEGAGLVRDDRHEARSHVLVPHQVLEQAHERHGRGGLLLARSLAGLLVRGLRGQRDRVVVAAPLRHEAAQLLAPLHHVRDLRGVGARVVVRDVVRVLLDLLVRDRDAVAVPEHLEVVHRQLLHLVRGVAALEGLAQAVALDGVGQDHGGLALVLHGGLVGGVDLLVVVAAALEAPDLVVGHVRHHLLGDGGPAEEVVAHEAAGLGLVGLVVAVERLVHDAHELALVVGLEQRIPLAAPQDLDDVPAGAPEVGLQLLDDLAVAAHRPVETLQVAVDHEGEVVELVVGRDVQLTARLGLVHLAVAEEGPHVLVGGVLDAVVVQVPVGLRLEDGVHRPQAHGHGGVLPEVRHHPRVRVGGQGVALAGLLLAEAVEVLLGQAALEERAGVVARRGVALEEDVVAAARVVLAAEEVVQAHLVEGRLARVGGDVAADADAVALGALHEGHGVPPQVVAVAALELLVARVLRLLVRRDRVHVVRGGHVGQGDGLGARALHEGAHDVLRPLRAALLDESVEGLDPLRRLLGILVRELVGQTAADLRALFGCAHGASWFSCGGVLRGGLRADDPVRARDAEPGASPGECVCSSPE